jgi:sugar phosphate isomerase/epimerase
VPSAAAEWTINMGKIKRGVSLYSLQDEYATKRMSLDEMFSALKGFGVEGIEVLSDQMIHGSPHPSKEIIANWKRLMDTYGFESVANDIFVNSTLYRNRRLTVKEQLKLLDDEIINSYNLGFNMVRLVSDTNPQLIEPSLKTAEKYNVTMALEIHAGKSFHTTNTQNYLSVMKELSSPYVGILLDTGIFCRRYPVIARKWHIAKGLTPAVAEYIDSIFESGKDPNQIYGPKDPHDRTTPIPFPDELKALFRSPLDTHYATFAAAYEDTPFEKLDEYLPYIKSIHGKFYEVTEDYKEETVRYEELIKYLQDKNWSGYICSEYEGNRFIEPDKDVDGLEQVRRHQEMLKTLIAR